MYMGGRVLEAEAITAGMPAAPGEREKGPPSGQPVSRCLIRWVGTPLGYLAMSLHLPHLEAPRPNVVAAQGPHLKPSKEHH